MKITAAALGALVAFSADTWFQAVEAKKKKKSAPSSKGSKNKTKKSSWLDLDSIEIASFDPMLKVPKCKGIAPTCSSGLLLDGRDSLNKTSDGRQRW